MTERSSFPIDGHRRYQYAPDLVPKTSSRTSQIWKPRKGGSIQLYDQQSCQCLPNRVLKLQRKELLVANLISDSPLRQYVNQGKEAHVRNNVNHEGNLGAAGIK